MRFFVFFFVLLFSFPCFANDFMEKDIFPCKFYKFPSGTPLDLHFCQSSSETLYEEPSENSKEVDKLKFGDTVFLKKLIPANSKTILRISFDGEPYEVKNSTDEDWAYVSEQDTIRTREEDAESLERMKKDPFAPLNIKLPRKGFIKLKDLYQISPGAIRYGEKCYETEEKIKICLKGRANYLDSDVKGLFFKGYVTTRLENYHYNEAPVALYLCSSTYKIKTDFTEFEKDLKTYVINEIKENNLTEIYLFSSGEKFTSQKILEKEHIKASCSFEKMFFNKCDLISWFLDNEVMIRNKYKDSIFDFKNIENFLMRNSEENNPKCSKQRVWEYIQKYYPRIP